jgi:excisionase family DNA binding protein
MKSSSNTSTPLLTIADAATLLNVSKATIRRWTNDGRLKCSRIGAREERRFRKVDLLELVKQPQAETRERSGLAAEALPASPSCVASAHCCMISNDVQEEWATLGPEILKRLGQGAQVLVIEDSDRRKRLENLLTENGLNKRELVAAHALRCVSIEESYFLSGKMQWDRAVAFIESAILEAKARGFNNILVIGTGSWATDSHDEGVVEELRKYELGLDRMLSRHPGASVLCPYAATHVSAQMIVQAFTTHPVMQIHSTIMPGFLERSAYRQC